MNRAGLKRFLSGPWGSTCYLAAVTILWSLLYARHGFSNWDEGFVSGLSWRVVLGQFPHLDFVYIRPPLSPLLHALPMLLFPANLVVLFERSLFFLMVAFYSHLAATTLHRLFEAEEWPLSRYLLSFAAFVFSVQSFPPMPWHTVDGVFWGAIGCCLLIAGRSRTGVVLGAVAVCLSALSKQSFYFLAPISGAYVLVVRGRGDFFRFAMTGAAVASFFAAILAWQGALGPFLEQTTSALGLGGLYRAGFLPYVREIGGVALPALVAGALVIAVGRFVPASAAFRWAPFAVLSSVFGVAAVSTWTTVGFRAPAHDYPAFLFLLAVFAAVPSGREGLPRSAALLMMLGLGWCASLSWGYRTPVLFGAPIVFGLVELSRRRFAARPWSVAVLLLVGSLGVQWLGYREPYRAASRAELHEDLGKVFPRLTGIRTSATNRRRFAEMKRLHRTYGEPFTVLPAMPLAHFLTGSRPPIAIDWARNVEIGGQEKRLWEELSRDGIHAFVEREYDRACGDGRHCCEPADRIRREWRLVEQGEFFDVYRKKTTRPTMVTRGDTP